MANAKIIGTPPEQAVEMQKLLTEYDLQLPKVGDVLEGTVISAENNEIHIDIGGICTGVVRGPELFDESGVYTHLEPGESVAATVLEIENELGEVELSFRLAGHKKAWDALQTLFEKKEVLQASITDANKGGLIVRVGNVSGFLPVSQLTVEHYPRVEGGNKSKILERLQTYIGQSFTVRIIDVDEIENKMIVSEKAAKESEQSEILSKYKVGDAVEGIVTGVVDFGAFVEFDEGLEGLVHISELAWQRIDDPKDIVAVGNRVRAVIIAIDHGKISLSMRRLMEDPWKHVVEKYHIGDTIEGKVLKLNPFGAFVELDNDIHGLAHISELAWHKVHTPEEVLTIGDTRKFKIVSIEPEDHRLGLSLKQLQPRPQEEEKKNEEENTENIVSSDDAKTPDEIPATENDESTEIETPKNLETPTTSDETPKAE